MGIDYGTKRVGIALTDEEGSMAFPKVVLSNNSNLIKEIFSIISREDVQAIVLGESVHPSGKENLLMEPLARFREQLAVSCGIPVYLEPEFYSTSEARRFQEQDEVDASAAAIILERYLAKNRHG